MDTYDVECLLVAIKEADRERDYEMARSITRRLHRMVLEEIAAGGCTNPAELAAAALQSESIGSPVESLEG